MPASIFREIPVTEKAIENDERAAERSLLLLEVYRTAKRALLKLDIEFHRDPDVWHCEGWEEANQLRYAIEDFERF